MWKKTIYLFLTICLIAMLALLLHMQWLQGGRKLSFELMPTAKFLAQSSQQLPSFIGYVQPAPNEIMQQGQEMCIVMYPGELMRSGDSYDELRQVLSRNTSISINNRPLPFYTPVRVTYPGGIREIVDGQETGLIQLCFVPDLVVGLHVAQIQTRDLSGTEYTYSWAFNTK